MVPQVRGTPASSRRPGVIAGRATRGGGGRAALSGRLAAGRMSPPQTVRAYLHREDFPRFWTYMRPWTAKKFLREWCRRVMRSRIEPMKKIARSLWDQDEHRHRNQDVRGHHWDAPGELLTYR
jgi:hypothetical protein